MANFMESRSTGVVTLRWEGARLPSAWRMLGAIGSATASILDAISVTPSSGEIKSKRKEDRRGFFGISFLCGLPISAVVKLGGCVVADK